MEEENEGTLTLKTDPNKNDSGSTSSGGKYGNGRVNSKPVQSEGIINKLTGTGENAKNGISALVVIFLFVTGIILTILVCREYWGTQCKEPISMLDSIKGVWGIVTPLLTLILGYVFGKGK